MALHHAASGEVVTLGSASGPEARSVALMKTDSFETIHLIVPAGGEIPEHMIGGSLSLCCLEGEAIIDIPGGEARMKQGDWLYLDPQVLHAIRGVTDAGLLLTVLFDRPTLHDSGSQSG